MQKDLIRYDLLVQDALKSVVRKVLVDAAKEGLPGEHHFYISFRTDFANVRISNRLKEKYPQEMTIVLQHQFWDLIINDQNFEVGLSFSGIPERLLIPYEALTGFFDPSVQFGLKFEVQESNKVSEPAPPAANVTPLPQPAKPEVESSSLVPVVGKPKAAKDRVQLSVKEAGKEGAKDEASVKNAPAKLPTEKSLKTKAKPAAEGESAEVVSLDAFRKKP
jgi:uncharacterized protein